MFIPDARKPTSRVKLDSPQNVILNAWKKHYTFRIIGLYRICIQRENFACEKYDQCLINFPCTYEAKYYICYCSQWFSKLPSKYRQRASLKREKNNRGQFVVNWKQTSNILYWSLKTSKKITRRLWLNKN